MQVSGVQCTRWRPVDGLDVPCADLLFHYTPPDLLGVRMRFSNVRGGQPLDLGLQFRGAISMRWESESIGLVPLPEPLPKCSNANWADWTFPLLRIEHSPWLVELEARRPIEAERRVHFALVTMNDLLHVLARDADANWVEAPDAA